MCTYLFLFTPCNMCRGLSNNFKVSNNVDIYMLRSFILYNILAFLGFLLNYDNIYYFFFYAQFFHEWLVMKIIFYILVLLLFYSFFNFDILYYFKTSLGKWLSVRLQTKWLGVWISMMSLKLQICCLRRARSSLTFRQTIECGLTLKLICDMIVTYS